MRSARASEDQQCLPFEVPPRAPTARGPEARAGARTTPAAEDAWMRCRLRNDALASRGWPSGTELLIDPDRRPQRGEVALAREGSRLRIGVMDVCRGRVALHNDHGVAWLASTARLVGVVVVASAPLAGMPAPPPVG
ncbi:MAG TPA: hypothetical protein VNS81_11985 [Nocardioides sp.]|nr:hypothetical protein [Nocardioides sp.]